MLYYRLVYVMYIKVICVYTGVTCYAFYGKAGYYGDTVLRGGFYTTLIPRVGDSMRYENVCQSLDHLHKAGDLVPQPTGCVRSRDGRRHHVHPVFVTRG